MVLTYTSGNDDDMLCANIPILDDNLCEADEIFNARLTTTDSDVIITTPTQTITIEDNDGRLQCSAQTTKMYVFINFE